MNDSRVAIMTVQAAAEAGADVLNYAEVIGLLVSFAIPWEDHLLLGTTDDLYEGDPSDVQPTEQDISQILDEAGHALSVSRLRREDITYAFAGLRVLPAAGSGGSSEAKRETVISTGRNGMLSVAGGKWTTYRHIGEVVLDTLAGLPGHPLGDDLAVIPRSVPLPGIASSEAVAHRLGLSREHGTPIDPDVVRHLASHYGSVAFDVTRLVRDDPALGRRIHPRGPDIWAQVSYARDHEWAVTVDDITRRRLTLTIRGLDTPEIRNDIQAFLD